MDDFFIPQTEWPNDISPAFPFPYFHYKEFVQGVCDLAKGKIFKYRPYNWTTNKLGKTRVVNPKKIIIVEGVSILFNKITTYFDKKILVMSDQATEFSAICQRENNNVDLWKRLYLPSVDIYWQTNPFERADILYSGRGIADSI